jgi:lipopolysaccharide export system protein LptC
MSMSANATANGNGQAPVSAVARAGNSAGTSESDRRAMAYLSASRHSSRVRFLKFTLPLLAAIFIGAFYYYSRSDDVPLDKIELSAGSIENGKIVMANPVLKGFNSDNLPYRMTAERAIQDVGSRNLVALENIRASIPVDKSNTAIIGAETGTYNNARRTLKVNSPLTVSTSDGMTAKLQSAFIEMKSGSLQTNKPVEIENKGSLIKANSMTVKDNGRVLVFEKNVQLTITPDQLKSAGDKQQKQEGGNAK